MASTYSPNLRLELIGTGEQQGTWGDTTNTNLGTLLEEAIGGYRSVTVSDSGDTTLTTNNGAVDQSRNMVINLTGTLTAARNVICPAIEKLYVVKNATTGGFAITFKVSGQTGVLVPNGETYFLYVDGTDANKIVGSVASTNATNTFTENQIIEVTDNTDAALRITQLGTGNALLIEDSANPDSTPTVIDASGGIVVGTTSALATDNFEGTQITPKVQVHATTNENSAIASTVWVNSVNPSQAVFSKSRSGTINTHAIVQSGDSIGAVSFAGDDGTTFVSAASILAAVDGTPGTNDMPGRLVFSTTADGASAPTEHMRINSNGNVNIGTADDPESALQITGTTNPTGVMVGSVSGTTLTVTAVTSGSIAVGDRLFIAAAGLNYNTYVTALGTGTGGTGTYTVNTTTTLASTTINFYPSRYNTISFVDNDTTTSANQPFGGIEWYSSDASTPGAGVKAYIAALSESATPASAIIFGTADAAQAVESMRITSTGQVGIGTNAPTTKLDINGSTALTGANTEGRYVKVGDNRTGNGNSYIDLIGDATYTTYGARFIRANTGPNATSSILHRGTGNLEVTTVDAAPIVFSTSNTEVARIDTTGRVGIGVTPVARLDVYQSGANAAVRITQVGSGDVLVVEDSASTDTTPFIVKNDGKVGVGTSAPDALLSVNGIASFGDGAVATPSISHFGDLSTGFWFPSANNIAISTAGTEALRITAAGRVLIGTDTARSVEGIPSALQVSGTTQSLAGISATIWSTAAGNESSISLAKGYNATAGTYTATPSGQTMGSVKFGASDGSAIQVGAAIAAETSGLWSTTSNPADLTFGTVASGASSPSERMRITQAGYVGVGTASPACVLDVVGGIQTTRTGVTAPAATDGNVFSGTYTPTLTGITNVAASTAYACQYMRVGNVITVSGRVDIDPTAAGSTVLEATVPVASNFNSIGQVGGTFAQGATLTGFAGAISSNATSDNAVFTLNAVDGTNRTYWFSFTYLVR